LQNFCEIHNKQNFVIRSVSIHRSNIPPFTTFNHTQNIATFKIHIVSLQTLRSTTHRNVRYVAPHSLRFNMYRKPHHKFLENFPLVDVSQGAMWVSSQSSERVTGEGSFAKGFCNVIWFSKRHKKIKKNLDQMEAINPLNHYYNLYCLGRLSKNINKVRIALLLFLKIKLHNGVE